MKSIGSSSNSISQSLREQVVQISIDIDDKTKIAKLLEKKIKQERLELSQIEDVSDVYTNRLTQFSCITPLNDAYTYPGVSERYLNASQ